VFEITRFLPDTEGSSARTRRASGFASAGNATMAEVTDPATSVMIGFPSRWWIAGGWVLDLFLSRKTRPHADLKISILDTS